MLHIIDDEEVMRDSLAWLARSRSIEAVAYENAEAFLSYLDKPSAPDTSGECILLDVRMPAMSGIALFGILEAKGLTQHMPVIFLTGHGDVPMAVDALKKGAFDFFEKPFNDNKLMDRVQEALAASKEARGRAATQARLSLLSTREKEVLNLILEGKMNKVIANELGISMRTVEVHRAHIFDKMQVKTAVELARMLK
ncbi:response regulator [Oxalobacteraceae bacterium R-40]|uniref:Response regulator n=1 Tax=Keguizhuia sedimenti TaxID=3064264 RepID=A0ABU1BIL5_9BURK|nr:response regulator [Oxalobacteraceae bacterium R-40]